LKSSLEKLTSRELNLKQRFEKIRYKQSQFGAKRPYGSYMDPTMKKIFTEKGKVWVKKPMSPDRSENDSPDVDEKTRNSHAYKVH
jgi:hypothetical protein